MLSKAEIISQANQNGFQDVGFTTADPFDSHKEYLMARQKEYGWAEKFGLALMEGTDPQTILREAKTIIVLMEVYFGQSYPKYMEGHFGRCYLDDDRMTLDGLVKRILQFCGYLNDHGIKTEIPFNLPHRVAAARAGMGTFGKNCLFYSNKVARQSSWVLPIAVVIDKVYAPGEPTIEMGCPDWCRNACIAACPTRALKGNGTIDPQQCISYLSYYGKDLTPEALREPMGLYVYGCDRCQNVCPRNAAWLAQDLPLNQKVFDKEKDFQLQKLLHMDEAYFKQKIWPHMFYMSSKFIWKWKMNVARVMGNTNDRAFTLDLIRAYGENSDERIRSMIAWALGKLGGDRAVQALKKWAPESQGHLNQEIVNALGKL